MLDSVAVLAHTVVAQWPAVPVLTAVPWSPRHPRQRLLQRWEQAPWFLRHLRAPTWVEGPLLVPQQQWGSTTLRDTIPRASTLQQQETMAQAWRRTTDPVPTMSTRRDSAVTVRHGRSSRQVFGACTSFDICETVKYESLMHWLAALTWGCSIEFLFDYKKVNLFWIR